MYPHDKICPDCGSYMDWCNGHYECPECGHVGRKLWRWQKTATIFTILSLLFIAFYQFVIT